MPVVSKPVRKDTPEKAKSSRRSPAELAQHHQRLMLLAQKKGHLAEINKWLKEFPEDIPDVHHFLVSKGRVSQFQVDAAAPEHAAAVPGDAPVEAMGGAQGEDSPGHDFVAEFCGDTELAEAVRVLGRTLPYWRFGGKNALSAKSWEYILAAIEPVALSRFAIRALVPYGKRSIDCEEVLRIVEYMTDLDENTPLSGTTKETARLIGHLRTLNEEFGRPAKSLKLPVDWPKQGWYRVVKHTIDELTLQCVKDGRIGTATPNMLTIPLNDSDAFLKVSLDANWSLSRAALVDASRMKRCNCQMLIASASTDMKSEPKGDRDMLPAGFGLAAAVKSEPEDRVVQSEVDAVPPPPA